MAVSYMNGHAKYDHEQCVRCAGSYHMHGCAETAALATRKGGGELQCDHQKGVGKAPARVMHTAETLFKKAAVHAKRRSA